MNMHVREQDRLAALDSYDVLDSAPEESFDRITRLARQILQVPMSTVSLIDAHRQWFKSRQGVESSETRRSDAICDVAIRGVRPLVIPDTLADERFVSNPYVTGKPHVRFYAGVPLVTPDGYTIGTLCVMDKVPRSLEPEQLGTLVDLAAVVVSELELRKLATTDALTGALTRRGFREQAVRAIALASRHGHPLSGIMFDLDHFKGINDANGHMVGDRVLVETVRTCRSKLRKSDLLGRIGGEEFAILLPYTTLRSAAKVADKLRTGIAGQVVAGPGGDVTITASFGIAALDPETQELDGLMQRADAALYVAKENGRNQCVNAEAPGSAGRVPTRRRVLKAGRISFNGGQSTIDCTVRTLSETGAGLDVISSAGIPERFKLRIEADEFSRLSHVVNKAEKHLEVEFAA